MAIACRTLFFHEDLAQRRKERKAIKKGISTSLLVRSNGAICLCYLGVAIGHDGLTLACSIAIVSLNTIDKFTEQCNKKASTFFASLRELPMREAKGMVS